MDIRHIINLIESTGYQDANEDDLRREASIHFGANDNGELHPDDANWVYNPALPLSTLLSIMSRDEWLKWFEQENQWAQDDGRNGYNYLVDEDIEEPIVITIINGKVCIWDGWHRVAATFAKGDQTIQAIIGTPKGQP